jgi:hypothetical protein
MLNIVSLKKTKKSFKKLDIRNKKSRIFKCSILNNCSFKKIIIASAKSPFFLIRCFYGEFDPGSELMLGVCLTHASRTVIIAMKLRSISYNYSGKRVSNIWIIYLKVRNSSAKAVVIPHNIIIRELFMIKDLSL